MMPEAAVELRRLIAARGADLEQTRKSYSRKHKGWLSAVDGATGKTGDELLREHREATNALSSARELLESMLAERGL